MNDTELLPDELLWAEGGHASDVVLTALADGESAIVPGVVRTHIAQCPTCMTHLGHTALLALETHRTLPARRRAVPRLGVALGLLAAALGLVPWLFESDAVGATQALSRVMRAVAALSTRLDTSGSTLGVALTYLAAVTLVACGLAFARLSPKKEVSS